MLAGMTDKWLLMCAAVCHKRFRGKANTEIERVRRRITSECRCGAFAWHARASIDTYQESYMTIAGTDYAAMRIKAAVYLGLQ